MATALVLALGQPFLAGWGRGGRAAELQIPGRERPKQGVGMGKSTGLSQVAISRSTPKERKPDVQRC